MPHSQWHDRTIRHYGDNSFIPITKPLGSPSYPLRLNQSPFFFSLKHLSIILKQLCPFGMNNSEHIYLISSTTVPILKEIQKYQLTISRRPPYGIPQGCIMGSFWLYHLYHQSLTLWSSAIVLARIWQSGVYLYFLTLLTVRQQRIPKCLPYISSYHLLSLLLL